MFESDGTPYMSSGFLGRRVFITGGAGFIGSHLTDALIEEGYEVVVYDNFSTGQRGFLARAGDSKRLTIVEGDLLDVTSLREAMKASESVFHFAANADVRFGLEKPDRDFEQNTLATHNVLEAMRANGIRRIAFSSTGSVYGEASVVPTPEDAPFPIQTSLYGASKLAGEGLIQAYCEGFDFEGYIFRFVSILGERYTHGHVFDFYRQLIEHPDHLKVLGDGHQRKSYLYVRDCVAAILWVMERKLAGTAKHRVETYNLGCDEFVEVNDSIRYICSTLGVSPRLEYSGGARGWVGDNPFIFLDTRKVRATGWRARLSIEQGIGCTLEWLQQNRWIYEVRK
jgi:UDP-glucose 4-epimerase